MALSGLSPRSPRARTGYEQDRGDAGAGEAHPAVLLESGPSPVGDLSDQTSATDQAACRCRGTAPAGRRAGRGSLEITCGGAAQRDTERRSETRRSASPQMCCTWRRGRTHRLPGSGVIDDPVGVAIERLRAGAVDCDRRSPCRARCCRHSMIDVPLVSLQQHQRDIAGAAGRTAGGPAIARA
jgi:hypothetical protein